MISCHKKGIIINQKAPRPGLEPET